MSRRPLTPEEIAEIQRIARVATEGTWYDLLRVDQAAAVDEVGTAYNDYVRAWHPDRFFARDLGDWKAVLEENFVAVTRAWRVLKDERQRAAYDRELEASGRRPERFPTKSQIEEEPAHEVQVTRGARGVSVATVGSTGSQPGGAAPPLRQAPAAIRRVHEALAQQFAKARQYYEAGRAEAAQGNWAKAESAVYLATRYDPKNADYQAFHRDVAKKAREARAVQYIALAEQAEGYARYREAIESLRKAVECDPPSGLAWFRLSRLLLTAEDDVRGAAEALRKAVLKEPANAAYRFALAEIYDRAGLKQNALRELKVVLDADPRHEQARAMYKRLRE